MLAGCGALAVVLLTATCSGINERASSAATTGGAHRAGSLVQADALGNTVIGGDDATALAFRFRAAWTGSAVAARFYVIQNTSQRSGYSSGTGGTMRLTLRADSGSAPHRPVGPALASTTFRPATSGVFPLVRFGRRAHIVAGRYYHVVFQNIDSQPQRNYVSINGLYSASRLGRGPAVPSGMAVLEKDRGSGWFPRRSRPHEFYLPILEIVGARPSQRAGLGYMEVWDPKPIGGDAGVRQLLRTPAGRTTRVKGAWLRIKRERGTDAPLVIGLGRSDGAALASATLASSAVPTATRAGSTRRSRGRRRSPGAARSRSTASAGPRRPPYEAFPIRKGVDYGFDTSTYFDAATRSSTRRRLARLGPVGGSRPPRRRDLQFALDVG